MLGGLLGSGLHMSLGTLETTAVVLVIIVLLFWVVGKFR